MLSSPLADRIRPQNLEEFFGQKHLVGEGKLIRRMIEEDHLSSIIFWGPPGSGKTTLARIIARSTNSLFFGISGISAGKEDLTKILGEAKENLKAGKKTILFIDEIHRWNKAQQDYLLSAVEDGTIILIGATTENPSFEVINPLLSRTRVFVLEGLSKEELKSILKRALEDKKRGLGKYKKTVDKEAKDVLLRLSGGDARILLNAVEISFTTYPQKKITAEIFEEIFQKKTFLYDKKEEEHYNTISAFIKSLRGSDPDAALYYLVRMIAAGEDPKFIARRMIIFASEDIGLADRGALIQANAAFEAVVKIGYPEASLILAHIAIYLAKAAKSRLVANSLTCAQEAVSNYPNEPVPLHLRNAPTKLMGELGYGKNYKWSKEYVGPLGRTSFLPEKLKNFKIVEENE